jgi:hypothetical protein
MALCCTVVVANEWVDLRLVSSMAARSRRAGASGHRWP